MPLVEVSAVIPAPAAIVFALLHDYSRRLEWDTLLSEAYLEPPFACAQAGAISVCRGRVTLGGFALRTQYVSFQPGRVAAIKLLNRPPLFETFAATIRHTDLAGGVSRVQYVANFTAKPRRLRPIVEPLLRLIFRAETNKRLQALQNFFATGRA